MGACGSKPQELKDEPLLAPEQERDPEPEVVMKEAEKAPVLVIEAEPINIESGDGPVVQPEPAAPVNEAEVVGTVSMEKEEVIDQQDKKKKVQGDHEEHDKNENEEGKDSTNVDKTPSEPVNKEEEPPSKDKNATKEQLETETLGEDEKNSQTDLVDQQIQEPETKAGEEDEKKSLTPVEQIQTPDVVVDDAPKTEEATVAAAGALAQPETPNSPFPDIGNTFRSFVSNITKGLPMNNNK